MRYCEILRTHLFRNAINIGLPIFECPDAAGQIREGDEVEVNIPAGEILEHASKKRFKFEPFPPEMQGDYSGRWAYEFCKKKI